MNKKIYIRLLSEVLHDLKYFKDNDIYKAIVVYIDAKAKHVDYEVANTSPYWDTINPDEEDIAEAKAYRQAKLSNRTVTYDGIELFNILDVNEDFKIMPIWVFGVWLCHRIQLELTDNITYEQSLALFNELASSKINSKDLKEYLTTLNELDFIV